MDRKAFLEHVAWTGSGIVWTLGASGIFQAQPAAAATANATHKPSVSFVQISDSHIGFARPENTDVAGTLQKTIAAINALPQTPDFVVHTGDVTHLAKAQQFDDAKQLLSQLKAPLIVLPGEHDVIGDPKAFFGAFGRSDAPDGWFSFDRGGAHFLALINVFNFEIDGKLGSDQLDFITKDLAAQKSSTPIVVFAHVPLFALYPTWGWTTEDGSNLLAQLRRFDNVTVLNGHVHQIAQHTEGNIRFATAASTAYPQPAPGAAPKPGPLKVAEEQLVHVLGYRTVELALGSPVTLGDHDLAG